MKIGTVKKFGLKKRDGGGVPFGFLTEADGGEAGIYFNEKLIHPASRFKERYRKGCLVVYEVRRFKKDRTEAFGIRLLEELDGKEQLALYRECRDGNRDAELELLRDYWRHPVKKSGGAELGNVQKFGLINKQGEYYGFLRGALSGAEEIYFNEKKIDPASKFRAHYRENCRVICKVKQLRNGRLEAFDIRLLEELDEKEQFRLYQKLRKEHRGRELTWLLDTLPELLNQESDEDVIFLILMIKAGSHSVSGILKRRPELLWTSQEVCSCVSKWDIQNLPLKRLIQTDEQTAFLAEHAEDGAWEIIAGQLSDTLLFRCRKAVDRLPADKARYEFRVGKESYIPGRILTFLSSLDWTGVSEDALARVRALLAKCDWIGLTESQIAAISPLLECASHDGIVALITQTRAAGRRVASLLRWKPELLWTSQEVCSCVRKKDIENLPLGQLIRTDEQTAFLAEHAGDDAWEIIVPQLSDTLLFHCRKGLDRLTADRARLEFRGTRLTYIPGRAFALLSGIDWTAASEDELARGRILLGKIDWIGLTELQMAAIRPLLAREPYDGIVSLVAQARAAGNRVASLLEWKPELLWTSQEVCSCVHEVDIRNLPLKQLILTDGQAAFLAEHAGEDAWSSIARQLSDRLCLHCRRALDNLTASQALILLSGIDWNAASEDDLAGGRVLLAKVDWAQPTERQKAAIRPLLERVSYDDIVSLVTQARAAGSKVAFLLEWKPELLWTSQEVCACIRKEDIRTLPLEQLILTEEQATFLAQHTGDDAWEIIAGKLSYIVLLHCQQALDRLGADKAYLGFRSISSPTKGSPHTGNILGSKPVRAYIPGRVLTLLSGIDWTAASEDDLTRGCSLLAKVDWIGLTEPQMTAVTPLLERKSHDDIVSLITQVRKEGRRVASLLEWKPELLWTSQEVCECVCKEDIKNLPLEQLILSDEQAAFLADHAGEDVWEIIAEKLSGTVLLHCQRALDSLPADGAILSYIKDRRYPHNPDRARPVYAPSRALTLLSGIDWTAASEDDLTRGCSLLAKVNWIGLTEPQIAAIRPLLERESHDGIVSLVTQVRAAERGVSSLLVWKPELLWTSQEVCACVCKEDIKDLPLEQLIQTDEQAAFLAQYAREDTWKSIALQLSGTVLLHCQRALDSIIADRTAVLPLACLSSTDWTAASEDNLARGRSLLANVNWSQPAGPQMAAISPLLESVPHDGIVSLIAQVRAAGRGVSALLEWKPELLLTSPKVCACIQRTDIQNLPLEQLIRTDEQAAFLAQYVKGETWDLLASRDAWRCIAEHLSGIVLLHCRRALDSLGADKALDRLSGIDWTAASEDDLARTRSLLREAGWTWFPESRMAAIGPLLEREPHDRIVSLITQVRAAGRSVSSLLMWKPELLWTSPEVCACVREEDIKTLPLEQLIQTAEQAAFLAEHAGESTWRSIFTRLSDVVLLRCQRALENIPEYQIRALLSKADWTDTREENLEKYRLLLGILHWNKFPDTIMAATVSLHARGMALELCWWQMMTDSMKIRLLMYLSDFAKDEQTARNWSQALQKIRQWEDGRKNNLVCSVLQFFAGIYIEDSTSYQDNFLKAHHMLMGYITDCFTQEIDVTPELSSLLEHCRDDDHSVSHFCDGRSWKNANRVYCPGRGYSCLHYRDMDLTRTKFRTASERYERADYKDLSFMDFLLNIGGIPNLDSIKVYERQAYPFRISAYVNGLIRLRPHMKCSYCGELFHPEFQYAKLITAKLPITVFHCSRHDQEGEHDQNVYLNFCYHCHEIIDSRECRIREKLSPSKALVDVIPVDATVSNPRIEYGQYLCMHCGGSARVNPKETLYCPSCGCGDPMFVSRTPKGGIVCEECGYDSSKFRSRFEKEL